MRRRRIELLLVLLLPLGCAADSMGAPRAAGDEASGQCFQDRDCGAGLLCRDFKCVASDGLPPEQEVPHTFLRPAASAHAVFALSPEGNSLALIDPATLAIEALVMPAEPLGLAVVPGADAAVVASRAGKALTLVQVANGHATLRTQRTPRRFGAVALSPDGRWALLWTPDGQLPDAGAEGIIALVDVDALAAGAPVPAVELAAGRRHTNVFFRAEGGVATEAVVVGKSEIAVVDLLASPLDGLPHRVALPAAYTELSTREAVAPPSGDYVLVRSLATHDLGVFDVKHRLFSTLTLPAAPTDLDIDETGTVAIAVLRETSQVAWFPLPAALTNPALVRTVDASLPGHDCAAGVDPCLVAPGQAVLSPDGTLAAVFTNARASETFGTLSLATGAFRVFDGLEKLVRDIGLSPDGRSAVVLHRPEAGSTVADAYERQVDQSEGYSLVDLSAGLAQLKLTDDVPPLEFVFARDGSHAAVTLRSDVKRTYRIDALDLRTLVVSTLDLASAPQFTGALGSDAGDARVWVTQAHPAGRISFVDLSARTVRTATGYELNAEIGR
jgi:hypothetical protein